VKEAGLGRRRLGFWQWFGVSVVKPTMIVMTRRDWRGLANIPAEGPAIIVANHLSQADPFALAHFVFDAGRWPAFLAKDSLFRIPVFGPFLRAVKQTPVARGTTDAATALDAAVASLRAGNVVIIYPEGTTTKEPELWPMRGKTGVARLWLATGAPVVPVVSWGPQRLFDPRTRRLRPVPRTPVTLAAGPPLDLSRWAGAAPTAATLQEISEHIMLALRDMLAEIRGGPPPPLWSGAGRRSGPRAEPAAGPGAED
jgi:1-acyl-sn-glycerol-3-phosphate acyltransferase